MGVNRMSMDAVQAIPALEGGQPVRTRLLPYGRQCLDDTDCAAVMAVLRGDFLTTGPTVPRFEAAVADYVGARFAVAFMNGTSALHAACHAAGIQPGDEVITSPLTFVATANAVLYTGGTPVFADVSPLTRNLDPACIEPLITPRTKALLPVDFAGLPVEHSELRRIAQKYGLVVIEDAAHALGAAYHGTRIGALSDLTMFSFHPVKAVTTGEGGMITTDDEVLYHRLMAFRSHGIARDPATWLTPDGSWYYEMQSLGFNLRMTDVQAALGISQMGKLPAFLVRRREIARRYDAAFKHLASVVTPAIPDGLLSGWHLYVIQLIPQRLSVNRRRIFDALRAENIGVQVHYVPVYKHPYYRGLGYGNGLCPAAERCYDTMLTLPLFPAMSETDVQDVIDAVLKVCRYYEVPA